MPLAWDASCEGPGGLLCFRLTRCESSSPDPSLGSVNSWSDSQTQGNVLLTGSPVRYTRRIRERPDGGCAPAKCVGRGTELPCPLTSPAYRPPGVFWRLHYTGMAVGDRFNLQPLPPMDLQFQSCNHVVRPPGHLPPSSAAFPNSLINITRGIFMPHGENPRRRVGCLGAVYQEWRGTK